MDAFNFIIMTPYKVFFSGKIQMCTLKSYNGEFTVLKDFQNFITTTVPCIINIVKENQEKISYFISGGILEVKNGEARLFVSSVENKNEIDIDRAELSKDRANNRLNSADDIEHSKINDIRAKLALDRAIERINFAKSK